MLTSRNIIATLLVLVILLPMSLPIGKAQTTVTIGVIAASDSNLASKTAIAQIAMDDINAYMSSNSISYTFSTSIKSAQGNPDIHLDMVKALQTEGIGLINGVEWSDQAQPSLDYCNLNHILLMSSSATSPSLEKDDNLFRLCPSDTWTWPAIAHMIKDYGYKYTVIIWRGDWWGDGLVQAFKAEYTSLGGTTIGDSSTRYPSDATNFIAYLNAADSQVKAAQTKYKTNQICVLLVAVNEAAQIVSQAENYPTIYGTKWFGTDGTAGNYDLEHYSPYQAIHLRVFSPQPAVMAGQNWDSVASRYADSSGQSFNSNNANDYDIYWILALSVIQAGSSDPMAVKEKLPSVAVGYDGVSGNCQLNEYGDRPNRGYRIWGFGTEGEAIPILNYGSMYARINARVIEFGFIDTSNVVTWEQSAYRLIGYATGSADKYSTAYSSKIVSGKWDLTVDDSLIKFTLTYSEKNLNSDAEHSPVGSVDYFYVTGDSESAVTQTSSGIQFQCNLHFRKDWAIFGGGRRWVEFDLPAMVTVNKNRILINLSDQNLGILGTTTTFNFR